MKNTVYSKGKALKIKLWGSIFILALLFCTLLSVITVSFINTTNEELNILNEKQMKVLTRQLSNRTQKKLASVNDNLRTLKEFTPSHKTNQVLADTLLEITNATSITSAIAVLDAQRNILYQSKQFPPLHSIKHFVPTYNANQPEEQYISEPFTVKNYAKKLFFLTLPIINNQAKIEGAYLAVIDEMFFSDSSVYINSSNLTLAVKSSRSGDIYYGRSPSHSTKKIEFTVENTPFTFVLSHQKNTLSLLSYIQHLFVNVNKIFMLWGCVALILLTFSLCLLVRQYKIAKDYKQLSNYDSLTAIYNRRSFMEKLAQELTRASRYDKNAALIMIDLDYFKSINDKYGYKTGDDVLKQFSLLLSEVIRESDIFARLGGEEFAILLPETSLAGGIVAAKKYRQILEDYAFSTKAFVGTCTASFGVTAISELPVVDTSKQLEHIITLADKALYEAKIKRNCVKP